MRRVLATAIVLAAIGGFALIAGGADGGGSKAPHYWVELDNAFGLTPGSDFKIAGVRAGKLGEMKVDKRTHKALVGFTITQTQFGQLKTDVTCESKPQSLIGEYFIDCAPGRNSTVLKPGSTIPVTHTFSTIAPDLVNNILRLPQRERLRVILNELGIAVAGRGTDVNAVVRRAVPALHETDRLLNLLANENQTLSQLALNADTVVGALANNRSQVSRFVREARDTSAASADRRVALAANFRLLPAFLTQLRLNLRDLGQVADEQIPTLHDLDAASGNLKRFLVDLGPFSNASRPSLTSLGETANVGRQTIPPATATVKRLAAFSGNVPELGQNLAIVLEDLRDHDRGIEPDPRAPNPKGFNGFEALLGYVFTQSQAINIFDRNGYILKVALVPQQLAGCSSYHDQENTKGDKALQKRCASWLGPNQPGITTPDPTPSNSAAAKRNAEQAKQAKQEAAVLAAATAAGGPTLQPGAGGAGASGGAPSLGAQPDKQAPSAPAIDIGKSLDGLLGGASDLTGGGPDLPAGASEAAGKVKDTAQGAVDGATGHDRSGRRHHQASDRSADELLNYLFAP